MLVADGNRRLLRKGVNPSPETPMIGNGGPGKIEGKSLPIPYHLYYIGVEDLLGLRDPSTKSAHLHRRILHQGQDRILDHSRRNEWLIALDVNDDVGVQFGRHLRHSIGPREVTRGGQMGLSS